MWTGTWHHRDSNDDFGALVRYGRQLVLNTAYYIGPDGKVSHNPAIKWTAHSVTFDAGTRPYAFSYFSSHARYRQYRAREDKILACRPCE